MSVHVIFSGKNNNNNDNDNDNEDEDNDNDDDKEKEEEDNNNNVEEEEEDKDNKDKDNKDVDNKAKDSRTTTLTTRRIKRTTTMRRRRRRRKSRCLVFLGSPTTHPSIYPGSIKRSRNTHSFLGSKEKGLAFELRFTFWGGLVVGPSLIAEISAVSYAIDLNFSS